MKSRLAKLEVFLEKAYLRLSGLWRESDAIRFATGYFYFCFIAAVGAIAIYNAYIFDLALFVDFLQGTLEPEDVPPEFVFVIFLGVIYIILALSFFDTIGAIASTIRFTTVHEILFVSLFIAFTIVLFSKTYEVTGLVYAAGNVPVPTASRLDHLYFTVVTWTTLGYGDILPSDKSKIVVLLNVSAGVIANTTFLAAVVTLAANAKGKPLNSHEADG